MAWPPRLNNVSGYFLILVGFLFVFIEHVHGHGRLIEPPSRGTMWRYGFSTTPDYNDHELYCGGFTRQWQKNKGKCGICGDPWDSPTPRPHEAGGKWGQGVIARKYKRGAIITIRVELTANHRGYFEFRLCPNNSPKRVVSQECLNKYLLNRVKPSIDNGGETPEKYYPGTGNRIFEARFQLPKDLECSQCVLQWKYIAGNNWGDCVNGTQAVGCGAQEEFRACADIAIGDHDGGNEPNEIDNTIDQETPSKDDQDSTFSSRTQAFLPWFFILFGLVLVFIALLVLYFIYYKRDHLKRLVQKNRSQETKPSSINGRLQTPIPPPRSKKLDNII